MIDIILAEDHNIVRNGIRALLEKQDGIMVTGEAVNGNEVLELLDKGIHADIILADMNMPGMGGLDLTEKLKEIAPECKVIILSMLDHEKYVVRAFKSGAVGYVLKNVSSDELIFAIKHVSANNRFICSELAMRFLDKLVNVPEIILSDLSHDIVLTAKEQELLELIAEGYTNHEISEKIFTSKRTVDGYRQTLMNKTGSRNTAALIKFAVLNGLIG